HATSRQRLPPKHVLQKKDKVTNKQMVFQNDSARSLRRRNLEVGQSMNELLCFTTAATNDSKLRPANAWVNSVAQEQTSEPVRNHADLFAHAPRHHKLLPCVPAGQMLLPPIVCDFGASQLTKCCRANSFT